MDPPPFSIPDGIALSAESAGGPGPRWVVARAEEELVARYGFLHESEQRVHAAMFDPPAGAFLVARATHRAGSPDRVDRANRADCPHRADRADPVGGVGVRDLGGLVGEVKRLWVDPAWRGRGVGRTLMAALEDAALKLGLVRLELGTGDRQPEAVALYAATEWERCFTDDAGRRLPDWYIRYTKQLRAAPDTTPAS